MRRRRTPGTIVYHCDPVHPQMRQEPSVFPAPRGEGDALLPQTDRDAIRTLLLVRVSLADSLGPGQTGHSCLGVQGVAGSTVI
jgi:hypothetical protein